MEVIRDLLLEIGINANTEQIVAMQKRINELIKRIGTYEKVQTKTNSEIVRSNRRVIDETQASNKYLSEQNETIRRLAQTSGTSARQMANSWSNMSDEMKKSLIRNYNELGKFRNQLMETEGKMFDLSQSMGHYTGSNQDFMNEIKQLGAEHKKITDQMINNNIALRQEYIRQAATVMNLSTTSSKIIKVYDDTGNALYKVNKPLLAVTDSMEKLAQQGNPIVMALSQLGPNASMKELQDRINLINTGIARQQALLFVAGIAWLGFTAILANAAMGPDVKKNLEAQAQAWADYNNALKQRTAQIYDTFSLFEQVQIEATSPRRLYLNLQQQVKVMQGWMNNLATLSKRGVDEGMIAELRKMGPAAAGEIAALTQMSDKGLDEYVAMWRDKHRLARVAATTELEKLREETAKKVQALKDSLKPLGLAVEEFKSVWATALGPFVEFWGLLASYVVKAGTQIGLFVQKLNEISPWITKIAGMFVYLTATAILFLTPMAVGIGYLAGMRVAFFALWQVIKPVVLGLASVGGTAMLVAAGVIALGAAFYLLWTRSEKFKNAVISGWEQIKQASINVWGSIKPLIMDAIGAIVAFGQDKLTQLKTFWDANGAQILQAAHNIWTPIGAVIKTVLGVIWSIMKFVWPAVLMLIQSVWGNIKGVISGALNVIMGVVKIFTGLFTLDFKLMWEGIKQVFFGAVQFVWNFIQLTFFGKILGAGKLFITSFRSIITALWTGIKNAFVTGVTFVRNFFVNGFTFLRNTADSIFNRIMSGAVRFITSFASSFMKMVNQVRTIFGILRSYGESIFRALWNTLRSLVSNIASSVRSGFTTMKDKALALATNLKTGVTDRFTAIVDAAKALPKKIGDGIKGMAKHAMSGIKHLANTLVSGLAQGVNGVSGGINWVFEKIGVDKKYHLPDWTPPKYAKGTNYHPGGPAIVGDGGGPELMRTPAGQVALSPGKPTLVNLPRGSEVLPHRQTATLMSSLPAYKYGSKGDGTLAKAASIAQTGLGIAGDLATGAAEGVKNIGSKVKDIALDAFQVFSNPKDLMAKAWDKFGGAFPTMQGAFGQIGSAALSWVKDKALNYVTGLLPAFGGSGGDMSGVLASALAWTKRDTKYVWGGGRKQSDVDKGWFDCSGFIYAMLKQNGINLSVGNTDTLLRQGTPVDRSQLIPGDLVFFDTYKKNGHVGFNLGNNQFVGSQSSTGVAVESFAPGTYFGERYFGVNRRIGGVADSMAGGGAAPNVKGSIAAWRPYILKAAAQMKEAVTPAQVQGILAQIDRESDGNQRVFQNAAVNDINMRNGNPARGLLQYIPSTFRSYMVSGHTDILNGFDQLLAFFNNTNWRRDLPYGRRGWGPTGARKYARGTNFHLGGPAIVGDGNGPEWIQPPKGPGFLSPGFPTGMLLPRGSSVTSHEKTMRALNGTSKQGEETYNPQPGNTGTVSRSTNVTFAPVLNIKVEGGGTDTSALEQKLKALVSQQMQEQWDGNFMRLLVQLGLAEEGM